MAKVSWLLAVLLTVAALAAPARRAWQWRNVTVSYAPEDEVFARSCVEAVKASLPVLQDAMGLSVDPRARDLAIRIDIYRRRADFDAAAGFKTQPWVQGLALGDERRILLFPLVAPVMRTVTAHELTHLLLDQRAGQLGLDPPRWLHEGLAKLASDDFTEGDREVLGQAVLEGRFVPLAGLEAAFGGTREQQALAYAESYTLVRYLHDLQPGGGLESFLKNLALTNDVDRALLRTYGQPAPALQAAWQAQVETEYLRRGIPLTVELLITGLMALVGVLAFRVQARRRAEIRRRLQEEELLRGMFKNSGGVFGAQPPGDDPFSDQE